MKPETSLPTTTPWQEEMRDAVRDPVELCERLSLPNSLYAAATEAAKSFPVFAPHSYIARMEAGKPDDPLLRQVLPLSAELESPEHYSLDPVGDQQSKSAAGLLQKYDGRVLLITTGLCAIHCRYCFRRHYPYHEEPRSLEQWQPAIDQIAADETVHEVILSGGDPLTLADSKLAKLVEQLDSIPHVSRLRIHTRLPIVIPSRVNSSLIDWLSATRLSVYVVLHANHANELSIEVWQAIRQLREASATLLNQAVILRGVNDSLAAQSKLCEGLSNNGVLPYYLHQLDAVRGASHFEVSVEQGKALIASLRAKLPGYAVPRYVQEIAGDRNKRVLA